MPPPPKPIRSAFPGYPDLPPPFFERDATYGQLFTNLSRCVRQAILLEARIQAGAYDRPAAEPDQAPGAERAAPPAPSPPQSHRRAPDDTPRLRPEQVEDDLAADARRPVEDVLADITAELSAAAEAARHEAPARTQKLSQAERSAQVYQQQQQQRTKPPPTG